MKLKDRYFYPAVFSYNKNSEITVTFPDFHMSTKGIDDGEALASARELLGQLLIQLEETGIQPPNSSSFDALTVSTHEQVGLIDAHIPSIRQKNSFARVAGKP